MSDLRARFAARFGPELAETVDRATDVAVAHDATAERSHLVLGAKPKQFRLGHQEDAIGTADLFAVEGAPPGCGNTGPVRPLDPGCVA